MEGVQNGEPESETWPLAASIALKTFSIKTVTSTVLYQVWHPHPVAWGSLHCCRQDLCAWSKWHKQWHIEHMLGARFAWTIIWRIIPVPSSPGISSVCIINGTVAGASTPLRTAPHTLHDRIRQPPCDCGGGFGAGVAAGFGGASAAGYRLNLLSARIYPILYPFISITFHFHRETI